MRLADRIAAWFGYVPKPKPIDAGYEWCDDCEQLAPSNALGYPLIQTGVVASPSILVTADYKRGIPCS